MDNDGFADMLIGGFYSDSGASNAGEAYLILGGAPAAADVASGSVYTGTTADDLAGCSVAGAGDTNGDGLLDLLVGAYESDVGAANAGGAYLLLGVGL